MTMLYPTRGPCFLENDKQEPPTKQILHRAPASSRGSWQSPVGGTEWGGGCFLPVGSSSFVSICPYIELFHVSVFIAFYHFLALVSNEL